ncbi:MAG: glycerol acyltransferase [Bacteroidales bacterium]|nr:glycerol acyltransferase [Bacteroidales bacterium]
MELKSEYMIDLDSILRKKFPRIPGFLVRWIKKLVHIDFLNGFIGQGYQGVEFARECIKYLKINLVVEGLENIRTDGGARYTFACNHPLGGADAIALVKVMGELFGENCRFPVNDFLMNIKGLSNLFIPVNKVGRQSRELALGMENAFASDVQIGTFPAGKCSRKIDGKIQDVSWGKSFITKSLQYGREVVPCRFFGHNSKRFYRVDKIGKLLGMKFPLAMILLPDELYKAQGSTLRLVIGKPLPPEYFNNTKTPAQWAADIRGMVYSME